ncbi:MAG TPA: carboxypeptidase regulatory-like domain-containing protein [Pyrinomonadaceae bacterium]|nr:carboxypeptidase regulatory-like domain-containing protein [Pyrinomonadaceae bacterium]
MKRKYSSLLIVPILVLAAIALPSLIVSAAGGQIEGKVTDPKGAAVIGAAITVTDPETNQTFTTVTDDQGKYSVAGLPPGTYSITISATGFNEGRRDEVKVEEGATAAVDMKLEIAPVEAAVTISTSGMKPNSEPAYQELRLLGKTRQDFEGRYATVNNLMLTRDAANFLLRSGEIYFAPEVNGRTTAAIFFGEGELSLTPPTEAEKHSLVLFTKEPALKESFTKLVLRFTDKTFEQIKSSAQVQMKTNGPQAGRANDAYQENQSLLRKTLRRNMELRTLVDLYNPQRHGFFTAFIDGKRYNKLVFQYDPMGIPSVSPEEVLLSSYGITDGGDWVAFHKASEIADGTASSDEDHRLYDIIHHQIDASIRGTKFTASDTLTFKVLDAGARVLPFRLFAALRVSRIRDEKDRELQFIQEKKDEDAELGLIWPEPLEAGKTYKVTVDYAGGDVVMNIGGGNFFVNPGARLTWYPNNVGTSFGDRATFDVSFGYPKGLMLIGTGAASAAETQDGNLSIAKWSSGETDLAVAGFNYGGFKKKEVLDKETGYTIEFYANDQSLVGVGAASGGSMSTMGMANSMLADAQNSTRIFNAYFGKLPFTRMALTQQPAGNFGQAWPTLVYMPFTAFMDKTQRYMASGGNVRFATANFFETLAPHEIAHQWWGHLVGWKSYRDQWMSEGFAEFSASLYIQIALRDEDKFIAFWNEQRDQITQKRPETNDLKPYTVGPITQGRRLSSGKTRAAYQFLVYPKGAYILHMLRQMMKDSSQGGDKRFIAMMQDFIKSHYSQDVSTEDLKRIVEKHMTKEMDLAGNKRMDWFFDQWVYGTEMPSYQFDYQIASDGSLSGKITQSGVSPKFMMPVPLYVDYGKGWVRLGVAAIAGNSTVDLGKIPLPKGVKRAAICALSDVLALKIQNNK